MSGEQSEDGEPQSSEESGRVTPQYEFDCPYCAFFKRDDDSLRLQSLAKSHIEGWHA